MCEWRVKHIENCNDNCRQVELSIGGCSPRSLIVVNIRARRKKELSDLGGALDEGAQFPSALSSQDPYGAKPSQLYFAT